MTLALSTVWSGKNTEDGHRIVAEAKELGFDAIELHHSLKATTVKQILDEKERGNIQITSLHSFCPAVQGLKTGKPAPEPFSLSSLDTYERRSALKYALNTINFARLFQAQAIILHCGWVVMEDLAGDLAKMYRQGEKGTDQYTKLKSEFLKKRRKKIGRHLDRLFMGLEILAGEAEKQNVKIGIENRYFPSEIPSFDEIGQIMEKFEGAPIFYWHDVGHAQVIEELGFAEHTQYLESYQDKLIGIHLHDHIGLADHKVPYTGTFDFEKLTPFVKPDTIKSLEIFVAATEDELQNGIDRIRKIFKEN
jgi:sugar phosphate isomerase/epimerase